MDLILSQPVVIYLIQQEQYAMTGTKNQIAVNGNNIFCYVKNCEPLDNAYIKYMYDTIGSKRFLIFYK